MADDLAIVPWDDDTPRGGLGHGRYFDKTFEDCLEEYNLKMNRKE